jgi:hypothetical protein
MSVGMVTKIIYAFTDNAYVFAPIFSAPYRFIEKSSPPRLFLEEPPCDARAASVSRSPTARLQEHGEKGDGRSHGGTASQGGCVNEP